MYGNFIKSFFGVICSLSSQRVNLELLFIAYWSVLLSSRNRFEQLQSSQDTYHRTLVWSWWGYWWGPHQTHINPTHRPKCVKKWCISHQERSFFCVHHFHQPVFDLLAWLSSNSSQLWVPPLALSCRSCLYSSVQSREYLSLSQQ